MTEPGDHSLASLPEDLGHGSRPGIVFVVGAPRSGTKLLRHLLHQNSRIAMTTNETEFLPFLIAYCDHGGMAQEGGFEHLVDYLRLEDYFVHRRLEGHPETDFRRWQLACRSFGPADMFRAFLEVETGHRADDAVLGDKSPGYVRVLPEILSLFPEARVLHILRDPRSQTGSLRATFGKSVVPAARAWVETISRVSNARRQHPGRIHELRYEDLTTLPEPSLRAVCGFLGVPFEPSMLEVDTELERNRPGKGSGLRAVDRAEHQKYLSDQEILSVEKICGIAMKQHGYVAVHSVDRTITPAPWYEPLLQIGGRMRFAVLTVRRHGWSALVRKFRLLRARKRILKGRW